MYSLIRKIKSSILLFSLFIGIFSCSDELDFDQFDDLEITPELVSSIVFVEVPEGIINLASFITPPILPGEDFFTNDFTFEAFNEDLFARRVISGIITYDIENTTSKPLEISFIFSDEGGLDLDREVFNLSPNQSITRDVPYGPIPGGKSLEIIKNTSIIKLGAVNLGDYTSTSSLPEPKIVLKSKAEFKVALKR